MAEKSDNGLEMVETARNCEDWARTNVEIAKRMQRQLEELKVLYHKVMEARLETAVVTLETLKTHNQLKMSEELAEQLKNDRSVDEELL